MERDKNSGTDFSGKILIGLLPRYPGDFASEDSKMLFAIEKREKCKTYLK